VRRNRDIEAVRSALALVDAAVEDPSPNRVRKAHDAVQALPISLKETDLPFGPYSSLLKKLRGRCDVLRAVLDIRR
jgi:hypothetical protein